MSTPRTASPQVASSKVVRIVIIALLCDLLAFTMPLPLFPRLINDFVEKEAAVGASNTLLSHTLSFVRSIRTTLLSYSSSNLSTAPNHWDLTLLGGLLASLFSLCQFVIAPHLGGLSDRYGRRPVLLLSMLGNIASGLLWLFANSFGVYAMSRVVGGLSEGNVQLSIAVISDVTTPANRSKSLALVGVAFSLAFTLGPSLGAYFASRVLGTASRVTLLGHEFQLNGYAVPALMSLVLLLIETMYLYFNLPETRWWKEEGERDEVTADEKPAVVRTVAERLARLSELEVIHLWFLFFNSGAQQTLPYLVHDLFGYSNKQNGTLLGFIGILSSLLQGSYVRRQKATPDGPYKLAQRGVITCCVSLGLIALLPHAGQITSSTSPAFLLLYAAAAGLAFTSATVVNSLNALASLETSSTQDQEIEKGKALGRFRSKGQLGRALGPLVTTVIYFVRGPRDAYVFGAVGIAAVAFKMASLKGKQTIKVKAA